MPDPIPSPYDITPIARFPYEPGLSAWLAFLLCAAIGALCLAAWRKSLSYWRALDPIEATLSEIWKLRNLHTELLSPSEISRLSFLLRRLCGWELHLDLASASQRDLRSARSSVERPAISKLLDWCMLFDTYKYQPPTSSSIARSSLASIAADIESLQKERSGPQSS